MAIAATRLGAIGLALAFVLPLVPVYPLDLFEHFRMQYFVTGLLLVGAAGALRIKGWFDAAVIGTLLHACVLVPDLSASRRQTSNGPSLRVLLLNVHTSSNDFAAVRQLITDEHPDVLALVETDQHWLDELRPATTAFASRIEYQRDDNFGVALYAKRPLAGGVEFLGSTLPTIVAKHGELTFVLTHPIPPVSAAALGSQVSQLDAIAARIRGMTAVVVVGDLNATPWSRPFRRLVAKTGLCDSRAGFGLQASFPVSPWILRIPIDHVLASCELGVLDRRIGPDVGSDHLPVIVDLVLPAR